jgi:hypothetical protein
VKRHIERTRRGFRLRLSPEERHVLRSLPGQLGGLLGSGDPSTTRLFPPAYRDDPDRQEEFRRLMEPDLLAHKREALRVMAETVDRERLDEEQLTAWLSALNDLRLVLGTRLEVTEDTELALEGPDAPGHALYHFLGWLEEQAVEALAAGLDPRGSEG